MLSFADIEKPYRTEQLQAFKGVEIFFSLSIMKTLLIIIVSLFSFNVFAKSFFDKQVTNCKNGSYQLTIKGKQSLFDRRNILVKKNNQILINESYEEFFFPYSDIMGSSAMGNAQFSPIMNFAYKTKPQSVDQDMDFIFRASTNTVVMQTYSALQPAFGGDTPAIILQLVQYNSFVTFELNSQCTVIR